MPEVEYVYTRPKKQNKKLESIILLIILAIAAYFLFFNKGNYNLGNGNSTANETAINQTIVIGNETLIISIPPGYKGPQGLDYIRNNSASTLATAKSLCTDLFKGDWVDALDAIGCYNMQGFSIDYCSMDAIQSVVSLCNKIKGNPDCSPTQIACAV